jgi:ubiquinone/menaquinone biosynthesis C-methylase UbiE
MSLFRRKTEVCPWWLAYTFDNPLRRFLHDPDELLSPFVSERMTVADIGCGMGYFTMAMAKRVGPSGAVIAVDLQQKMLDIMGKRAAKAGVAAPIHPVLASEHDIRMRNKVDFVLLFWMVHEVKDAGHFFGQISDVLKEGGKALYVEPRIHVSGSRFREIVEAAWKRGFQINHAPSVRLSRSVLLVKSGRS